MKRLLVLVLMLSCLLAGCQNKIPLDSLVAVDGETVAVSHIHCLEIEEYALPADALRQWAAECLVEPVTFEPGCAPNEGEGGECYRFGCGFACYISGPDTRYILIESQWYALLNPDTPSPFEK